MNFFFSAPTYLTEVAQIGDHPDANPSNHHHFVCVRCGLMRDFYSDEFDALGLSDAVKAIGRVETTQVEVKGVCHKCTAKKNIKS